MTKVQSLTRDIVAGCCCVDQLRRVSADNWRQWSALPVYRVRDGIHLLWELFPVTPVARSSVQQDYRLRL